MSRIATFAAAIGLALTVATTAGAAPAKPDAHDRALAAQLNAKVGTFGNVVAQTGENSLIKGELKNCAPFKTKDPAKGFAAAFALLPALMVRLVDDYKPQITNLVRTVEAMHPDSPLFRKWATALAKAYSLVLKFDNHGGKIDLCHATTVILDKKSTAADYQSALGVNPALVAQLFQSAASQTVTTLDAEMRSFFIAAGLSAKSATTLTS
jgi:hypothetical protein